MKTSHSRKQIALLVRLVSLALALAACSGPEDPEGPAARLDDVVTVELDGYQAQVELWKIDQPALSAQRAQWTTHCDSNVAYNRVVVPLLGFDGVGLAPYVDVFWMPRNWNRKLVLYAHGYVAPGSVTAGGFLDLIASDPAQVESIDRFLCAGHAIGVSSYSSQGYAVQQGIAETHLMNAVFPLVFWRVPRETYIMGSSMGGLITVALAENFPRRYDGAMPTCGPIGGSMAEFSYLGNVRLLFDTAFPGVLDGSLTDWQEPEPQWVEHVLAAIATNARGFAALANTALTFSAGSVGQITLPALQTPTNYGASTGLTDALLAQNALLRALRYVVLGGGDVLARGGGSPFSNEDVSYGALRPGPLPGYVDPDDVYTSDAQAVSYYTRYYQPSGALQVPTLALHGWVDPDVPTFHEEGYRALVTSAVGPAQAGDFLRQYLVLGYVGDDVLQMAGGDPSVPIALRDDIPYGHCNFRPVDLAAAFEALVDRVDTGTWSTLAGPRFSALP